jgi:hypothetical protein
MIIDFTDSEYGEIFGSLANARDNAHKHGRTAPHIESAMAKMRQWASPAGCQFLVVTGEDADLIRGASERGA